jgi:hypothetical protein
MDFNYQRSLPGPYLYPGVGEWNEEGTNLTSEGVKPLVA